MIEYEIPVRTKSEMNMHEHWRARQRRAKEQRMVAKLCTITATGNEATTAAKTITLTRIAPGKLDSDNLAGSCKHVRDGIADAIGMDDGDERLTWLYAQRRGAKGEYSVDVVIEE